MIFMEDGVTTTLKMREEKKIRMNDMTFFMIFEANDLFVMFISFFVKLYFKYWHSIEYFGEKHDIL
jgi:hypothetical protein